MKPRYRKADDDSPADRCRIIPCPVCCGDGSPPTADDIDHHRQERCTNCQGTGLIEIELEDDDGEES